MKKEELFKTEYCPRIIKFNHITTDTYIIVAATYNNTKRTQSDSNKLKS